MPAMPIADSSAPIVVGIRQTSSETSTMPVTPSALSASVSGAAACCALEKIASGCRVATASRKMMVSAASRMFSAISLGVFCRLAPSTRAIIRSMKLSPGFWVIRTTIRSESTLVPPVTALRSPPDSRITGADSPVIADSSTLAMPSTTSPSPGMIWPASTTTMSPELQLGGRDRLARGTRSASAPSLPAGQPPGDGVLLGLAQRRRPGPCRGPRRPPRPGWRRPRSATARP